MVGSDVYSMEVKKTEVLAEIFRRAIGEYCCIDDCGIHLDLVCSRVGLRIEETKEVCEGEVTEITPTEAENPLSGYGKTISRLVVGLKTARGTKQLQLDPDLYEAFMKERITVGDVIYIENNNGAVKVSFSIEGETIQRI